MSAFSSPARLMVRPFGVYAERYRGSGTGDRVLRTLGWLGLMGVLLLRARRS